ncbi:MAG: 4Fe-4S binding protein, partial [Deltaproteobacteria bacterium]|nr:4Fe-4S binding protein [Deltaproteobacteria bacterium]
MKWTREAEEAVSKVPFFVRRRVKKRVEEEAERRSAYEVTLDHVRTCQRRFLKNMESEVKGHQVETCFGSGGCPNRAVADSTLCTELEELVSLKRLREFLKTKVQGPLKMHHEFRISVSDCPNACSRPQIADLGLIAAVLPRVSSETCSQCGACVEVCKEEAVRMLDDGGGPALDLTRCVACGQCIRACPRETMEEAQSGYRILVGG